MGGRQQADSDSYMMKSMKLASNPIGASSSKHSFTSAPFTYSSRGMPASKPGKPVMLQRMNNDQPVQQMQHDGQIWDKSHEKPS